MDNVKRQHYVWRHHLSAWADNEQIWTLRKSGNDYKVFKTNLMGVAQERYFYEQLDMDEIEEVYLEKFIDKLSSNSFFKNINKVFFQIFTFYNTLRKISNLYIHDSAKLEENLLFLKRNMLESYHTRIENLGMKLLNCVENKNYGYLNDQQSRF